VAKTGILGAPRGARRRCRILILDPGLRRDDELGLRRNDELGLRRDDEFGLHRDNGSSLRRDDELGLRWDDGLQIIGIALEFVRVRPEVSKPALSLSKHHHERPQIRIERLFETLRADAGTGPLAY
jgi:hypothetical protein